MSKKRIIIISIVPFLIAVYFLFPPVAGLVARDIAPPDDPNLRLNEKQAPAEEENAYYDFVQLSETGVNEEDIEKIKAHMVNEEWDEEWVEELLDANKEAMDIWTRAAERAGLWYPGYIENGKVADFDALFSHPTGVLRAASRISAIKSIYLSRQGMHEEALEESLKGIDIGYKLMNSQASLLHYITGFALRSSALEAMLENIQYAQLDAEQLLYFSDILGEYEDTKTGLKDSFRAEYMIKAAALDERQYYSGLGTYPNDFEGEHQKKAQNKYLYKPNKTKALFASDALLHINGVEETCLESDVGRAIHDKPLFDPSSVLGSPFILRFIENGVGKVLYSIMTVSSETVLDIRCYDEFRISAARTTLAMRAYFQNTGEYPDTLEELVSGYIERVPTDPFSGGNIIYNKDKMILYSVGKRGEDIGGAVEPGYIQDMENPTVFIGI